MKSIIASYHKYQLYVRLRAAIIHITAKHKAELRELKRVAAARPSKEQLEELEVKLAKKEEELRNKLEDVNKKLVRDKYWTAA